MASSVVVKVKYGDILRRFNATVNENQQMDLDIEGLRAKIRSLFNFTTDADINLTYVDEDHDMVALVDEEDLCDVVRQGLNPVRITVLLNTGKIGSARSSGTSTPIRRQGFNPNPNINIAVAELLKSVPEPFHEALSKLSVEVASKAASSSPVLAELIQSIMKATQSFLNANHHSQSSAADVDPSQELGKRHNSRTGKDASVSGVGKVKHDGPAPTSNCSEELDLVDVTKLVDESDTSPVQLNQVMQGQQKSSGANWEAIRCRFQSDCDQKKAKDINDDCERKLGGSVNTAPVGKYEQGSSSGKGTANSAAPKVNRSPSSQSIEERNMKSFNECAFSGFPIRSDYPMPLPMRFGPKDGIGTQGAIFHGGVQCDGCGVLPITGPRFKSKVKEDYDLCSICFKQMGNDADYVRMDFPVKCLHPWSFKSNPVMNSQPWGHPPPPLFRHPAKHMKQFRPKLDSRFIMDVNVVDGTIMAPKTSFTKIWRMRNNGNLPWNRGLQLLWIGGDKFSLTDSVEIKLPVAGLSPEDEVDVGVDFVAPELPGRYISYWRMASPSGQKFGQRVWVLIQVDACFPDFLSAFPKNLNLNLPPECAGENTLQATNMNVEPLVDVEHELPSSMVPITKIDKPLVDDEQQNKLNLPDDLLYDPFLPLTSASPSSASQLITPTTREPIPAPQVNSSQVLYPTVEADLVDPAPESSAATASSQVDVSRETEVVNDIVEGALLKELEEMGLKQVNLNKEVLRKNSYGLEQSVDELCGFSKWDLLLQELQVMGFVDHEANKRVLAKNNGNLKHAVMDLITRENA